jgi:hypothetical protein
MMPMFRMAAFPTLALLLSGCHEWAGDFGHNFGNSSRYKEDFNYSYDLKPGGQLSLENVNGSVEITGWDQNRIDITGTKYASSEAAMKALKIDVVPMADSVRIRTVPPSGHRGGWGAKYVIKVPHRIELDRIASSNGSIRIEALEGSARLRTSNGSVKIIRVKGPVEATTSNAGIEVAEHDGSLIAHSSNGGIRADRVRGYLEATTSNASINARLLEPVPGKRVRLDTSNGSISLEMAEFRGNEIELDTSNSSITLRLPPNAKAQLKANTSNSNIQSDFDVNVREGALGKSRVEGEINGGGPLLNLSTSNGSIRVLRVGGGES